MKDNLKSWNFKVEGESEKTGKEGFVHSSGN